MKKQEITITILLSLATTVSTLGFLFGGVSQQQNINTQNICDLQEALKIEVSDRKTGQEQTNIELAKINVNLEYIKQAVSDGKE